MASLKELKNRIKSIKSTQKITKAQKMVAASKLRRAQEQAEAARPYTEAMERMVESLAEGLRDSATAPRLLVGTGKDEVHLIVVATSDRGLCGAFNSSIVRAVRRKARELIAHGKQVKLLCVGKKGADQLRLEFGQFMVGKSELPRKITYATADEIASRVLEDFDAGEFDVAHVVYNKFKSAISQLVTFQQLVPLPHAQGEGDDHAVSPYEYEPSEAEILADLLPKNLGIQIYHALLENAASEQGARMTAMDNATRNAGDMIKRLGITYNRTRQAAITKELIEIISGAEAV